MAERLSNKERKRRKRAEENREREELINESERLEAQRRQVLLGIGNLRYMLGELEHLRDNLTHSFTCDMEVPSGQLQGSFRSDERHPQSTSATLDDTLMTQLTPPTALTGASSSVIRSTAFSTGSQVTQQSNAFPEVKNDGRMNTLPVPPHPSVTVSETEGCLLQTNSSFDTVGTATARTSDDTVAQTDLDLLNYIDLVDSLTSSWTSLLHSVVEGLPSDQLCDTLEDCASLQTQRDNFVAAANNSTNTSAITGTSTSVVTQSTIPVNAIATSSSEPPQQAQPSSYRAGTSSMSHQSQSLATTPIVSRPHSQIRSQHDRFNLKRPTIVHDLVHQPENVPLTNSQIGFQSCHLKPRQATIVRQPENVPVANSQILFQSDHLMKPKQATIAHQRLNQPQNIPVVNSAGAFDSLHTCNLMKRASPLLRMASSPSMKRHKSMLSMISPQISDDRLLILSENETEKNFSTGLGGGVRVKAGQSSPCGKRFFELMNKTETEDEHQQDALLRFRNGCGETSESENESSFFQMKCRELRGGDNLSPASSTNSNSEESSYCSASAQVDEAESCDDDIPVEVFPVSLSLDSAMEPFSVEQTDLSTKPDVLSSSLSMTPDSCDSEDFSSRDFINFDQ